MSDDRMDRPPPPNRIAYRPTRGARLYRGAPAPLAADACPSCGRQVSLTSSGRRRLHRDETGADCTGSGVLVEDRTPVVHADPDAVMEAWSAQGGSRGWEARDRGKPANRWSGKA